MARNRKIQSPPVHFGFVVKVLIVFAFIVGVGVGYIWQENQNRALAQKKKEYEQTLAKLQRDNKMRRNNLDALKSPQALEARIRELNLGLIQPEPGQIVRLPEPHAEGVHPGLTGGGVRIVQLKSLPPACFSNKEMLQ